MKTIGIIDITTVGACICANEIVRHSNDILGDDKHPDFIMHAFSFATYKELILSQQWDKLAMLMLRATEKLTAAGAEFIIIPSNTPHYCYDQLSKHSSTPILDLIQLSVDLCVRLKAQKVAVLGTKITMQGKLYFSKLKYAGIEQITIPEEDMNLIDSLIMDELIPANIKPNHVNTVRKRLLNLDCDTLILGCTELPDVFNSNNLPNKTVIDTTRLLAQSAVEYALE